ncbi:MAG: RluA family pseudouridine synthase [Anaerolineae bacterium]
MINELTETSWRVDESPAERLDLWLVSRCAELSRAQIIKLITSGQVLVNGLPGKPSYHPRPGDVIILNVRPASTEPSVVVAHLPPLVVVYEDEALLVINKPAGLVVHPGAGHPSGTLVQSLLSYRPNLAQADLDPLRPGLVHRLDKDTSGLLVVAATRTAQQALQAQFKAHTVEKTYLAILYGHLQPNEGAIEAPIARHPIQRYKMAVTVEGGRQARTAFRVREDYRDSCYVEAHPLTGRTHQIRVHFASVGHAVVGDVIYGPRHPTVAAPRQMLHAWSIVFEHPLTRERLSLIVEPPADFQAVLEAQRLTVA